MASDPINHDPSQDIRILYFAVLRDLVGASEDQVAWTPALDTVEAVLTAAKQRHPELVGQLHRVRVARNEGFVQGTDPVRPGDVIALIPPVAGG